MKTVKTLNKKKMKNQLFTYPKNRTRFTVSSLRLQRHTVRQNTPHITTRSHSSRLLELLIEEIEHNSRSVINDFPCDQTMRPYTAVVSTEGIRQENTMYARGECRRRTARILGNIGVRYNALSCALALPSSNLHSCIIYDSSSLENRPYTMIYCGECRQPFFYMDNGHKRFMAYRIVYSEYLFHQECVHTWLKNHEFCQHS